MPRHADHQQRRGELADAVCRIILEHGIDKVSVRSVAQESGWSVGAIRYYFPRQDDLLHHALTRTIERAVARIEAVGPPDPSDPIRWSREVVCCTAPVTDDSRRDIRIWLAFVDRGLSHENIAGLMNEIFEGGRYNSRRMVALMAGLPIPADNEEMLDDPFLEETAAVLHVMWNGISFQGLMANGRLSDEEICRLAQRVLNTISERVRIHQSHPQLIS